MLVIFLGLLINILYFLMPIYQFASVDFRTFFPFWAVIKTLAEKLSVLHMNLVKTWTDLMKDIIRYAEEQQKKHKMVSCLSVLYII